MSVSGNVTLVSYYTGGGIARQLHQTKGFCPKLLINRSIEKSRALYKQLGIPKSNIIKIQNVSDIPNEAKLDQYFVATDMNFIPEMVPQIDVVFESTGDIQAGARACFKSFEARIPFVTVNVELDCTIGFELAALAKEKGLLYSVCDGDQPGCLARIINQVQTWGFQPKIVGNCKGFYDPFQNPDAAKPFVPKGQNTLKINSYADGSKQSMELTSVGNAYGYSVLKRGMNGPQTTKKNLIETFQNLCDLNSLSNGCVDFAMGIEGIDQGGGVFVIAYRDDPPTRENMKYMKKGEGPNYLFFRDYHLCYFEAVSSIAEAVLFDYATLLPKIRCLDTIAMAKRDLKPGMVLDGFGGYDHFGLVENAEVVAKERMVPQGVIPGVKIVGKVSKGDPILFHDIETSDNIVSQIRN